MAKLRSARRPLSDEEQKAVVEMAQQLNKTYKEFGRQFTAAPVKVAQELLKSAIPKGGLADFFTNYWTPPPPPIVDTAVISKSLRYTVEPEVDKIKLKEKEGREKKALEIQIKGLAYQILDYQHRKRNFWYTRIGVPVSIILSVVTLAIVLFGIKLEFTEAYLDALIGLGVLLIGLAVFLAVRVQLNRNNQEPVE